jgi:hypothetical protein
LLTESTGTRFNPKQSLACSDASGHHDITIDTGCYRRRGLRPPEMKPAAPPLLSTTISGHPKHPNLLRSNKEQWIGHANQKNDETKSGRNLPCRNTAVGRKFRDLATTNITKRHKHRPPPHLSRRRQKEERRTSRDVAGAGVKGAAPPFGGEERERKGRESPGEREGGAGGVGFRREWPETTRSKVEF